MKIHKTHSDPGNHIDYLPCPTGNNSLHKLAIGATHHPHHLLVLKKEPPTLKLNRNLDSMS